MESDIENKEENYVFPWGFHLGDLHKDKKSIPLFTPSEDGGFCLLYDKVSEVKADKLLESLCLELLSSMPHQSLKVNMFDFGKKKFYHLSPLKYMQLFENAYDKELMEKLFDELEDTIVSRYQDLLCCHRQTINEHNQKSKMKQMYHLVLINLENFPTKDFSLRKIQNFVESAQKAGVYVIAFGNQEIQTSENETTQTILKHFKKVKVTNNEFEITEKIFEFSELLQEHTFEPLDLQRHLLMQEVLTKGDIGEFLDPENIKLEENTKV